MEPGWIRIPYRGREAEPHVGTGMCGLLAGLLARVLSPYTVVDKPGETERRTGGHESKTRMSGLLISVTEVVGGNGAAAALAEILIGNRTTGGMGIECLLCSDIGLNRAQLAAVRAMGYKIK